jgi:hypothetical protein
MLKCVVILMLVSSAQVHLFFGYSDWERLPAEPRRMYLAGAMDSLLVYVSTDEQRKLSLHYSKCMFEARMSAGQLSDNVVAYAKTRPELQRDTAQAALINYLSALCGKVPL